VREPAPLGRTLTQPHAGERRLDHVGGAQMLPVFGGEVEETHQPLPVCGQGLDRLGYLAWYSVSKRVLAGSQFARFPAYIIS
jgi:hypothetical protein